MTKKSVDIDLPYEDYFTINEMARKKKITFDEMVEEILAEYIAMNPLPSKGVSMILRQSDAAEMVKELGEQLVDYNIRFSVVKDEVFDDMVKAKED